MIDEKYVGSSFEDFLAEEEILSEVTAVALKRTLAWEVQRSMQQRGVSKSQMAKTMGTSRAALDRLLDPQNTSVTLHTLDKAARAIGKKIKMELV
jgi:DNA-binding Xre family transcriptional regulator